MSERYLTFASWCKSRYGRKLYRTALNAGMTCPNRDGNIGERGCIFCAGGSGDFAIRYEGQKLLPEDMIFNHQDASYGDYIAYFQAYTNTYAPAERLRKLFEAALEDPVFAGISIATRPDCMGDEVIALLKELKERFPEKLFMIELGLQTIHEESAQFIRRGYPLSVFDECVRRLHEIDIDIVVHIIIGLPHETPEMIYETIDYLNQAKIQGIKLQLLHVLKGTDLGDLYQKNPESFHVLSIEEYAEIVAECIARLDESVVVHRISGDGNGEYLLAPLWSKDKRRVLNLISHTLRIKNITQGCRRKYEQERNSETA